nr:MAG TPA: LAMBDA REPRESSOR (TRIPLE MUTANT)/DNA COMPLEX-DNA COMPLEX, DOUBLE HELIX, TRANSCRIPTION-DNA.1A [Caudoviricetes sp.]
MELRELANAVAYKHRLNQAQLGAKVGKSQSWAHRALSGKVGRCEPDVYVKLENLLNTEPEPFTPVTD